jgi:AcrR family transcriptional regulator
MRDVAAEAGMALGAAYYYFPSKDAIVAAYYDLVQQKHSEMLAAELPEQKSLKDRLTLIHIAKLEILRDDRPLMGALLRYTGHPDHPLSFFGKETEHIRKANEEIFADALKKEKLPQDLSELLPKALWALHMGFLLYFLYDKTPGQTRTRKLVHGATEFTVQMISVAKFPLLKPVRKQVMTLLKDAGLI